MEKLKISYPIIVEGKYDKIKILSVADACVIQTDGFGVFKNSERLALIRKLAEKDKIIVMTDSDGAGKVIRAYSAIYSSGRGQGKEKTISVCRGVSWSRGHGG